jgi:hypothetical protein
MLVIFAFCRNKISNKDKDKKKYVFNFHIYIKIAFTSIEYIEINIFNYFHNQNIFHSA